MKKIALLTLIVVLGGTPSAFAASPSSCPLDDDCAGCMCDKIECAEGESLVAARKRIMAAELARLVTRYVSHSAIRHHLLLTLKTDPARALDFVALAKAAFSDADRACFKRVSAHFLKC